MSIDLAEYTAKKRRYLKQIGVYCLYVIGTSETGPMKIGYAQDVVHRFKSIQSSHWQTLTLYDVLWCPGKPVATRVEHEIHAILHQAKRQISGEWFDVDAVWARRVMTFVSHKMYPSVRFMMHEQLIERLRKKMIDRQDCQKTA